jgi:aryl-alcohol dehydrogenase-like predicted oxidoreductase
MQSIVLGTAQWGSAYGVSNGVGRIGDAALMDLVQGASHLGITALDTAPAYGDAEERIRPFSSRFSLTTKVSVAGLTVSEVLEALRGSLSRLGVPSVAGCLVHDWPSLDASERGVAATALAEARGLGLVTAIGVSGYEPDDFSRGLDAFDGLDLAQGPLNVVDQRLASSGMLARLASAGCRFQARSAFLQGLLLESGAVLPLTQHPDLVRFRAAAADTGASPLTLCLSYLRSLPGIDSVVVGVTGPGELAEIAATWSAVSAVEPLAMDWASLASRDLALIDPRTWAR